MSTPSFAAVLLLTASSFAAAAPRSVAIRATHGQKTYAHTASVEPGTLTTFKGPDGMIVRAGLNRDGTGYIVKYEMELVGRERGGVFSLFSIASFVTLRAGEAATTAECGEWTVRVSVDGADAKPSAWKADGPNYRVTARSGKTTCRLMATAEKQSDVGFKTSRARPGYVLDVKLSPPEGRFAKLFYNLMDMPVQAGGNEKVLLGRRTMFAGGKVELLAEGPASGSPAHAAEPAPQREERGGAVPLLR